MHSALVRLFLFLSLYSLTLACTKKTADPSATSSSGLTINATPQSQVVNNSVSPIGSGGTIQSQSFHSSFLLPDNKVLLVPDTTYAAKADTEIFDVTAQTWTSMLPMHSARSKGASLQLADGRILATGGADNTSEIFSESLGLWISVGNLTQGARQNHNICLLKDGRALVAGGVSTSTQVPVANSETFDPVIGNWTAAGPLQTPRTDAQCITLNNGRVILIGGYDVNGTDLSSVEVFDPGTNQWSAGPSLNTPRGDMAATLLRDGRVVVSGGYLDTGMVSNSAEVFDPTTSQWTNLATPFSFARASHIGVETTPGKIILVGGLNDYADSLTSVEQLDIGSGQLTSLGDLNIPRAYFAMTTTADGNLIITGGTNSSSLSLTSTEIYDTTRGTSTLLGSAPRARSQPSVVQLSPTQILIAGGSFPSTSTAQGSVQNFASAGVRIDLSSKQALPTNAFITPRVNAGASLLDDGSILMFGGQNTAQQWLSSSEAYSLSTNSWTSTGAMTSVHGSGSASVKLQDGRILVAGGMPLTNSAISNCEVYSPTSHQWSNLASMTTSRGRHNLILLPDGRVMAIGGRSFPGNIATTLSSAEIYDSVQNTWTLTGSLNVGRYNAAAILLPDGRVLVAGGVSASGSTLSSEVWIPSTGLWQKVGNLGSLRSSGLALTTPMGGAALFAGGNSKVEIFDPVLSSWYFSDLSFARPSFLNATPMVTSTGSMVFWASQYADDINPLLSWTPWQPVQVQNADSQTPLPIPTNMGLGSYDSQTQTYYPPLFGNGTSNLSFQGSAGVSGSVNVAYSQNPLIPTQLTAGNISLASRTINPLFPKTGKVSTVTLSFSGSYHIQNLSVAPLSGDFSFLGGTYPGTRGNCGAEISSNCTITLQYSPTTAGTTTTALTLNYTVAGVSKTQNLTLQGLAQDVDPSQNVLLVYNSTSSNSSTILNYYLSHRPGMASANSVAVSISSQEVVSESTYLAQMETPILNWLQAHPSRDIRFIVLMYDLPSRVSGGTNSSVALRLAQAYSVPNITSGATYNGTIMDQYNLKSYPGTRALVTTMNMGSVAATTAYIDKLAAMYAAMPTPNLIISASASGHGGNKYLFEDAQGYAGYPLGQGMQNTMTSNNPSANSSYLAQNQTILNTVDSLSGYFSWGVHAGLPSTYATDGTVTFTGQSNWFLIATAESFNGQLGCSQGCISSWYASNAWGGSNYSRGPAGAVGHVEEPYVGGINSGYYFSMWETGFLFSEAAWLSRNTPYFIAVGDPLITK
jgi:N-acetylneuraminic acid mutarotase